MAATSGAKKAGGQSLGSPSSAHDGEFVPLIEEDSVYLARLETKWVVDSSATIHATPRRELFSSYTQGDYGVVRMGNAGVASAIGIGDICLENEQGGRLVLTNVKHIPEMRLNLLFVGRLDDEGYVSTFKDGGWKLSKGSLIVARGRKESFLYVLQTKLMATGHVNALEDEEATSL
ncbi:hypothetical protein Dimus_037850 [Dionaea muscipula]